MYTRWKWKFPLEHLYGVDTTQPAGSGLPRQLRHIEEAVPPAQRAGRPGSMAQNGLIEPISEIDIYIYYILQYQCSLQCRFKSFLSQHSAMTGPPSPFILNTGLYRPK